MTYTVFGGMLSLALSQSQFGDVSSQCSFCNKVYIPLY